LIAIDQSILPAKILDKSSVDVLSATLLMTVNRQDIAARPERGNRGIGQRHFDIASSPTWQTRSENSIYVNLRIFVVMHPQTDR
jgi:hypothetical protein